jgi:hypothetical protein
VRSGNGGAGTKSRVVRLGNGWLILGGDGHSHPAMAAALKAPRPDDSRIGALPNYTAWAGYPQARGILNAIIWPMRGGADFTPGHPAQRYTCVGWAPADACHLGNLMQLDALAKMSTDLGGGKTKSLKLNATTADQ